MKFLVMGCGSIGRRHIRNLSALSAGDIIAYDVSQERLADVAREYNINTYDSLGDALAQKPDSHHLYTDEFAHSFCPVCR